jgi:phthiocerol/phenolphthiocerol synthesis type-I polyketide synthase E
MSAADGVEIFRRIVGTPVGPQVLVTPYPLDGLATRALADAARPLAGRGTAASVDGPREPQDFAASRSDLEATLAKIWSEVLGVPHVGNDDNFFDLDGNSLVAVQLIAHVRRAVGVRLPMRSLFDAPTVAGMAAQVERLRVAAEQARQPRPIG